ncbi:hypothetical protein ACHAXN_008724 [Cyclotella atomus]
MGRPHFIDRKPNNSTVETQTSHCN